MKIERTDILEIFLPFADNAGGDGQSENWRITESRHEVRDAADVVVMAVSDDNAADVFLFAAYIEHKMIAGIWLIRANSRVSVPFYISHNHEHQELRPINLLYYEVIKQGLEWNQKYLDFGLFTVNMAPNYGLGRFKENFGAQGMFRDYFRKDYR